MNEQLLLENIRDVLNRLEETIIFGLIERGQFKHNACIYEPGALGEVLDGESIVGYLLHETEKVHARMRRYTSPDEHPFYGDLPAAVLPELRFDENPLRPNTLNINARIRDLYETQIVPLICEAGDDGQYGSSAVEDVHLLQSISKRIHYGKFVAESKYRMKPGLFQPLIEARDAEALMAAITDAEVERIVMDRVTHKTERHTSQLGACRPAPRVTPAVVVQIYTRWVIPLNKRVQVDYLLGRA